MNVLGIQSLSSVNNTSKPSKVSFGWRPSKQEGFLMSFLDAKKPDFKLKFNEKMEKLTEPEGSSESVKSVFKLRRDALMSYALASACKVIAERYPKKSKILEGLASKYTQKAIDFENQAKTNFLIGEYAENITSGANNHSMVKPNINIFNVAA